MTVFLVQDDLAVAALTATWLRALNFEVIVSSDGLNADALASRLTGPIDLLLTDVILTGIRGRFSPGPCDATTRDGGPVHLGLLAGVGGRDLPIPHRHHAPPPQALHGRPAGFGRQAGAGPQAASSHPGSAGGRVPEGVPDAVSTRRT